MKSIRRDALNTQLAHWTGRHAQLPGYADIKQFADPDAPRYTEGLASPLPGAHIGHERRIPEQPAVGVRAPNLDRKLGDPGGDP